MSSLSKELYYLILQFLDEEKFKETVHKLEQESGTFFNMKYFEEQAQAGEWDEVERYLSGFTKVDDNRYSMKIFFEIRKQKYLEALDKQDRAKAVEILMKDLKVFSAFNEELFKEITQLLTLDNFRENDQLSKYGDTKTARNIMLLELKKLIESNPAFKDKLQFPPLKASRLRTLINQSLNWQHQLCKNPRSNPDIKTLFTDHSCTPTNGGRAPAPTNNLLVGGMPNTKPGAFPPLGVHAPFPPAAASSASPVAGWMVNPPAAAHAVHAAGPAGMTSSNPGPLLKRPRSPPGGASTLDYQSADSDHILKRARPTVQPIDEMAFSAVSGPQVMYTSQDLPKAVARTLNQGSNVICMDFHPLQQSLLLVGTNIGDIAIWESSTRERLALRPFKVLDMSQCSKALQVALVEDPVVSVNQTMWSPDGSLIGVAFSKHMVQVYQYNVGSEPLLRWEIDAHSGSVNDLAFSHPNKQLCVITCGDDKLIKVWEAAHGQRLYVFEGHTASVYSVCPHQKENIQFIFSTATDGKIKAWLYDNLGSRVDYDAPGHCCTTMAYSEDGSRLFSCGTSKEADTYLVEWNESEGAIKRTYLGFRKRSATVVQFDTTRNRFLAAGDDFHVKFWDMDNTSILMSTDAEGGLQATPRICFNKDGSLLAVTANDNRIKILANADGMRLLRTMESRNYDAGRGLPDTKPPVVSSIATGSTAAPPLVSATDRVSPSPVAARNLNGIEAECNADETVEKNKPWKLTEIVEPQQCRCIRLPDSGPATKVSRLIYTNSGSAVLALFSNAVHKLWKWARSDRNPMRATASVPPHLWQPSSGIIMTNDVGEGNVEDAVPCIALSKNDSYVMSASGGKVSLFNMMTSKVMTTYMQPPPAATFLAFHPQDNNIIAVGMDDSSIQIYNVRVDEVKSTLKGHQKRITGLAFSNALNILVSSGADAQLCIWSTDVWEKRKNKLLQIPEGRPPTAVGDTRVQFHQDQIRLLVTHESQLAVYDAAKLEPIRQWTPHDSLPSPISYATYSCDSQLVFSCFLDGSVGVFEAETLRPRCRLASSVYSQSAASSSVFPTVISAHPLDANQFVLGLTDGTVQVIEPLESEGKWGSAPPAENGSIGIAASAVIVAGNQSSEQASR
eukprot:c12001_g1_i1 orf=142-3522(+)